MRRPQHGALLVALLLVVAGCASLGPVGDGEREPETATPTAPPPETSAPTRTATDPPSTATPTPTPTTPEPVEPADVTVEGGELPVDVGRIYARVEALTGVEAEPPTVVVEDPRDDDPGGERRGLLGALGLSGGSVDDLDCGTIASASAGSDEVRIVPDGLSAAEIELVLAHEFAHVLQENNGLEGDVDRRDRDASFLRQALTEGGAVYVANEYAKAYDLTWATGDRPLELRRCFYETAPDGFRTLTAVYYFGGEYFDRTLGDPSKFATAYERLPNTTEGLLHGEPAGVDPPVPLDVETETDGWFDSSRGSYGELTTRLVLASELSESRAATAAEGWGNDEVVEFERDGETGYAWVHRWDDADGADEFLAAVGDYAAARTEGPSVRVVRVDETTTVLLVGEEAFLDATTVDRTGETVSVTVGN